MSILNFGVIGVGYFGKNYIRLLGEMEGVALKATSGNKQETEALLNDPAIQCVVVASPGETHFEIVKLALERGKHVLVEKPMTMNLPEAQELKKAVRSTNKALLVGHQYVYNDYIRYLKEQIANGVFGDIRYIFADHFYLGAFRRDMGVFLDASPHTFAMIDYWFGNVMMKQASGVAVLFPQSLHDDFSSANVLFENGMALNLVASRFAPVKCRRIFVGGDKGVAVYDEYGSDKLVLTQHPYPGQSGFVEGRSSDFFKVAPEAIIKPVIQAGEALRNQLNHFIECIHANREPITGIEHGLRVARMLEFVQQRLTT